MIQSYKNKSRIATAIGGIATIITVLGVDQLNTIFPGYGQYIPAIVAVATWYTSQKTEDHRVEIAEKLAVINYEAENNSTVDPAAEYADVVVGDSNDQQF